VNNTVDLIWLQRDRQQPEDLIQLWEDYRFMAHCESIWSRANPAPVTRKDWNRAQQILLAQKVTRTTIQILEAIACIQNRQAWLLFKLHILMDFSWNDLRTAICSLRSFNGQELLLANLPWISIRCMFQEQIDSVRWTLICGAMRSMDRITHGAVAPWMV
jgi:hypothetical protein